MDYYQYDRNFEEEAAITGSSYLSELEQNGPQALHNNSFEYDDDFQREQESKILRTSTRLKAMKNHECVICMMPLS